MAEVGFESLQPDSTEWASNCYTLSCYSKWDHLFTVGLFSNLLPGRVHPPQSSPLFGNSTSVSSLTNSSFPSYSLPEPAACRLCTASLCSVMPSETGKPDWMRVWSQRNWYMKRRRPPNCQGFRHLNSEAVESNFDEQCDLSDHVIRVCLDSQLKNKENEI